MVRRKGQDRFRVFDRLPEEAREALGNTRNVDYHVRLAHNATRDFLTERGINQHGLESTTIPATINRRNWARFTSTPESYHPSLVREFYASMVPEVFKANGTVWVQGVQVAITSSAINEYLHTVTRPDVFYYDGIPEDTEFDQSLDRVARSLRYDRENVWDPPRTHLPHCKLRPELAFWAVFFTHSLVPSTHRTNVSVEVGRLLYAIRKNIDFDVGYFILEAITKAGCDSRCKLIFPCLITHFCQRAGIPDANNVEELLKPQGDICKTAYNFFCTRQGLPNLPTEGP